VPHASLLLHPLLQTLPVWLLACRPRRSHLVSAPPLVLLSRRQ